MKAVKIDKCKQLIERMGCEIDEITDNIIRVDGDLWCVLVEEYGPNELSLSFNLDIEPSIAANVAIKLSTLSSEIGMQVVVYESYAFKTDDEGVITDTVFGEDAYKISGRVLGIDHPLCSSRAEIVGQGTRH